jgi:poly(A) polymerase
MNRLVAAALQSGVIEQRAVRGAQKGAKTMTPYEIAAEIADQLRRAGYHAVFTGGWVRDMLFARKLGKQVSAKDIDIATNATPAQIAAVFPDQGDAPVGKAFGVMLIKRHGITFEVATFRQDGQYGDGRRPDQVTLVTTDDLEEALRIDGSRRDFTMNALYFDPHTQKVYNLFGGQEDIEAGVLRAVGDPFQRFMEDRLRMLRAIRFAASKNLKLDERLRQALIAHAGILLPGEVTAWERIAIEVTKTFCSRHPGYGLRLLRETGLLAQVMPEYLPTWTALGVQTPVWHPEGDTFTHICMVMDANADAAEEFGLTISPALGLGVALHDIAKPQTLDFEPKWIGAIVRRIPRLAYVITGMPLCIARWVHITSYGHAEVGAETARKICARFKLSTEITERVVTIVAEHMIMHDLGNPGVSDKRLFKLFRRPEALDLIAMQHADSMGTGLPLAARQQHSHRQFFLSKMAQMQNRDPHTRLDATAIVNGDHLRRELGLKPSALFGVVLEHAFEAQIEGEFTDVDHGLEWVRSHLTALTALVPPPKVRDGQKQKRCC